MTRWTLFLAAYTYKLVHRPGKNLSHADALSRCPLPIPVEDPSPIHAIFEVNELDLPITAQDIATHSRKDKVIAQVLDWVGRGWPEAQCTPDLLPFKARRLELSTLQGCLLWGTRVVIPTKLQGPILKILHEGHPGIVRMKALARSYVWWPGMDAQIASWVSTCQPCQMTRPAFPEATPTRWEDARTPWSRIHIDLAGPVQGQMFLIIVDSFSKWIDVDLLPSTSTLAVSRALSRVFATHGLPDTLVSDNGPQFTSCEFEVFTTNLGIRHVFTAPFHPASNGMAERAVRSVKETLARFGKGDWHSKLSRYLMTQHTTPCTATNKSPAELLMGRRLRTPLDRLHPHYAPDTPLGSDSQPRSFLLQDLVYARNYAGCPLWLPGEVVSITGPRSYRILLDDGRTWRRHIDQLRRRWRRTVDTQNHPPDSPVYPAASKEAPPNRPVYPEDAQPDDPVYSPSRKAPIERRDSRGSPPDSQTRFPDGRLQDPAPSQDAPMEESPAPTDFPHELRRSARQHRRPAYLRDYACSWPGERSVVFVETAQSPPRSAIPAGSTAPSHWLSRLTAGYKRSCQTASAVAAS